MLSVGPGQTTTISQDGLPSEVVVGYQVIKAATQAVAIGRTTNGVAEVPAGSGNYVVTFTAPVEPDLYLIVLDWSGGSITADTSVVEQLQVTSISPVDSSLGAIAAQARNALGGETFRGIVDSEVAGESAVTMAVENVKARVFGSPPSTIGEDALPLFLLSYLGRLTALELMAQARSFWSRIEQSKSISRDPTEIASYLSYLKMLEDLRDDLLASTRRDEAQALAMVPDPVVARSAADGPQIDEDDDSRYVTRDPRHFARQSYYPCSPFDDEEAMIR